MPLDLLKPLIRRVTYPAYERRDGFWPYRYLGELRRTEALSTGELREIQCRRLARIVEVAGTRNEFYRRRFGSIGFSPADFKGPEDLQRLPVLTKDDIRTDLVHSFTNGFDETNTFARRTGGSTGTPVLVYQDYEAASIKRAAAIRHNSWAGWDVGDRMAKIWGDVRGLKPWKGRLRNHLTQRAICLDTLHFDEGNLAAFVNKARSFRPTVIYGHAHSIYRLGEYVRESGRGFPPVKGIVTTSMVLSPAERERIESAFEAAVFDRYGCHETSIIASECEAHDGLHIFAEGVYVEVENGSASKPGRVLLTDLLNVAMPLIRYEVGDLSYLERGECRCGRSLPRLREIAGRTADFLYRPDGSPVFGISVLDTFAIHIPGIAQVQIIQDRMDHLTFNLRTDRDFSADTLALLRWEVHNVFGERMTYDIKIVDAIERTPAGKYRFSICKIPELAITGEQ